jgi:hypothetical protein
VPKYVLTFFVEKYVKQITQYTSATMRNENANTLVKITAQPIAANIATHKLIDKK